MKAPSLPISSFCKTGSGTTPSRTQNDRYFGGNIAWVKSGELRESVLMETEETVTKEALAETSLKIAPKGAILVAMYGANVGRVGMLGIEATTNQAICHIVPDQKKADSRYIFHILRQKLPEFISRSVGGAQPNISQQIIRETKIPLPPIAQQKRIAAILDKAEELRGLRRQALAQLDAMTQSIFLKMFGNPVTNPNKFPIQNLGELCSRVIDCPHSTPTYAAGITPYACVRSSDIQNSELVFSEVKYVELEEYKNRIERGAPQPGDVIYCREGARFGNAALVTDTTPQICLGQRMMLFRPEISKVNGEFVWGYLSSPVAYHQALREVGGSASPHINIRNLVAFQIPVPPLTKQQEFARRVEAIEQLKATHRESLTHLDALFASLQHRAFRGEL